MLPPIDRAIILLLHQYATREFGLKISDITTKLNIARVTVDRCQKKYRTIIKVCPSPRYPIHLYVDNDALIQQAPELGLVGENVLKRQIDLIEGATSVENRIDYKTHFGIVPIEQPVEILSQGVEELIESLHRNTATAVDIIRTLPDYLEDAYKAVSVNSPDRENMMQIAWQGLESVRAVAATYLKVCEMYMFDPRMNTPEYWAVFMHRIAGFHSPVSRTVFTETPPQGDANTGEKNE